MIRAGAGKGIPFPECATLPQDALERKSVAVERSVSGKGLQPGILGSPCTLHDYAGCTLFQG